MYEKHVFQKQVSITQTLLAKIMVLFLISLQMKLLALLFAGILLEISEIKESWSNKIK